MAYGQNSNTYTNKRRVTKGQDIGKINVSVSGGGWCCCYFFCLHLYLFLYQYPFFTRFMVFDVYTRMRTYRPYKKIKNMYWITNVSQQKEIYRKKVFLLRLTIFHTYFHKAIVHRKTRNISLTHTPQVFDLRISSWLFDVPQYGM